MSAGTATRANNRARQDLDLEFARLRATRDPGVLVVKLDTLARQLNEAHRSRGFTPGRVAALLKDREDVRNITYGVWEVLPMPKAKTRM